MYSITFILESVFSSLWNEKWYKPSIEPEGFLKNLPVLKSIEIDTRHKMNPQEIV